MSVDPTIIRLWPGRAPGATADHPDDVPTLTHYAPPAGVAATGAAMVVLPGGGYGKLADHEGPVVAEWAASLGITAFVLKYRIAPRATHPNPLNDAKRAIRVVRADARRRAIDPKRIGILGFSAGGHLSASACNFYDDGNPLSQDPIEHASSRPDLAILLYPVITMKDPFAHAGTRQNLLGNDASGHLIDQMSLENHVSANTPPTFIFHTVDDGGVPVENSLHYGDALRRAGVSFEMHLYESGPHGVGLAARDPVLRTWPTLCANWLARKHFANPAWEDQD
jgi:acetyl esterase/lipase